MSESTALTQDELREELRGLRTIGIGTGGALIVRKILASYAALRERVEAQDRMLSLDWALMKDHDKTIDRLNQQVADLTAKLEAREAQVASLKEQFADLATQLAAMAQERDDAVDAREGTYMRVDDIQVQLATLQARLATVEGALTRESKIYTHSGYEQRMVAINTPLELLTNKDDSWVKLEDYRGLEAALHGRPGEEGQT